ncbi:MAG: G1 family glutamic endopeptidase [Xanthobacteraceae bacterium]
MQTFRICITALIFCLTQGHSTRAIAFSPSPNWGGFIFEIQPGSTITNVQGSQWRVPSVSWYNYGQTSGFQTVAVWAGIGGKPTGTPLIQAGTTSTVDETNNPQYYAWYELVPSNPNTNIMLKDDIDNGKPNPCTPAALASCPVSANDTITMEIGCFDSNCATWEIDVHNVDKGWRWNKGLIKFSPNVAVAEWIVEAPNDSNGNPYPYPKFDPILFEGATVNGGRALHLSIKGNGIRGVSPVGGVAVPCAVTNKPSNESDMSVQWSRCIYSEPHPQATHNINSDTKSDVIWQKPSTSDWADWHWPNFDVNTQPTTGGIAAGILNWSLVSQRDFNGDGFSDFLWRNTNGDVAMWLMLGNHPTSTALLGSVPSNWTVIGAGDYNGDSMADILWRDTNSGTVAIWFMNGLQLVSSTVLGQVPSNWSVIQADGNGNIFWRNNTGDIAMWNVANGQLASAVILGNVAGNWVVQGIGDFNGDGNTDLLWRDSNTGTVAIWFLSESMSVTSAVSIATVANGWTPILTGDYNGDGKSDLFWLDSTGNTAVWLMNGATVASTAAIGNVGTAWAVASSNAE